MRVLWARVLRQLTLRIWMKSAKQWSGPGILCDDQMRFLCPLFGGRYFLLDGWRKYATRSPHSAQSMASLILIGREWREVMDFAWKWQKFTKFNKNWKFMRKLSCEWHRRIVPRHCQISSLCVLRTRNFVHDSAWRNRKSISTRIAPVNKNKKTQSFAFASLPVPFSTQLRELSRMTGTGGCTN